MATTTKQSIIVSCVFSNEYHVKETNKTVYYHTLTMENGDKGSIGTYHKNPDKLAPGQKLDYSIDELNSMKQVYPQNSQAPSSGKSATRPAGNVKGAKNPGPRPTKQEAFLGFTWAYAKDLLIAGKTIEDFQELRAMAQLIYNEIGSMIDSEGPIEVQYPQPKEVPAPVVIKPAKVHPKAEQPKLFPDKVETPIADSQEPPQVDPGEIPAENVSPGQKYVKKAVRKYVPKSKR